MPGPAGNHTGNEAVRTACSQLAAAADSAYNLQTDPSCVYYCLISNSSRVLPALAVLLVLPSLILVVTYLYSISTAALIPYRRSISISTCRRHLRLIAIPSGASASRDWHPYEVTEDLMAWRDGVTPDRTSPGRLCTSAPGRLPHSCNPVLGAFCTPVANDRGMDVGLTAVLGFRPPSPEMGRRMGPSRTQRR